MLVSVLKSKLHRGTVTDANLEYEGSISIDTALLDAARLHTYEKVDVLNINNGARFTTYIIDGKAGEICLNGAAARLVQPGDRVIIISYCQIEESAIEDHKPVVIMLDKDNKPKQVSI